MAQVPTELRLESARDKAEKGIDAAGGTGLIRVGNPHGNRQTINSIQTLC
jgi:hypothetical protein